MIEIPLRARDGSVKAIARISDQDAQLANSRWHLSNRGYAVRNVFNAGRYKTLALHREVLGEPPDETAIGDHINRDRLDNRRENLRWVTPVGSAQNRGGWACKPAPRGAFFHKGSETWHALVVVERKRHFLGSFEAEEDAARVAREFRIAHTLAHD